MAVGGFHAVTKERNKREMAKTWLVQQRLLPHTVASVVYRAHPAGTTIARVFGVYANPQSLCVAQKFAQTAAVLAAVSNFPSRSLGTSLFGMSLVSLGVD